ncbi:CHASE3 domain-containing protein [Rhizobium sp. S152]|uniref:sensor histidine kinase n=1 Tax=Rhizobium sp. S152 TaxID=3055038 RepID=UPI0025A938F2|nr:CHASE3 domain-containing protein [Rhizobium sp. S152]MDM9626323.1 CHASE3 domain-containing protein [Rhizobium sp. S152]
MTSTAAFFRSSLIMLAIGVLFLLGIVGSSLWLVHKNSLYSDETAQLRRVRSSIVNLLTTVQDAETGQRGFLLSSDPAYLDPYTKALEHLAERRKILNDNVSPLPNYAGELDALSTAIDGKMNELSTTVALAKEGKLQEAVAIVRDDAGREYMDQVRSILAGFLEKTDDRLRILVEAQLGAASNLQWVTLGGAVAILIVLGGAILIIVQHVQDLTKATEEVALLNVGLEERVSERTQDLIRANQEIQKFAYIVTHDLRAPLVNIMGFLSELDTAMTAVSAYVLADNKTPSEDEIREARLAVQEDLPEALGFIRSSTRKMDSLINAILKISRDGRRKLQPDRIDLKSLIEGAAANVHHQLAETGGAAEARVRVGTIVTDRFSLDQIFGNLFDNAVKYQAKDRPLRLDVDAYPDGPGRIRIDVKDNGRGIGPQDRERIFELFRRAGEQDQRGEGIGLAHVRSLIRNLGGDINVESELGQGSTFILTLPTDLTKIVRSMEL